MTMSRTKGPWHVAYIDENGQAVVSGEHTEVATCWHHCVTSIEQEMRANARLIAAAPDLLALVIQYRDDLLRPPAADSIERRLKAIQAALQDAIGE